MKLITFMKKLTTTKEVMFYTWTDEALERINGFRNGAEAFYWICDNREYRDWIVEDFSVLKDASLFITIRKPASK